MSSSEDHAVSATNSDATVSKRSAIQAGYWEDGYIGYFSSTRRCPRKPPIIHRGYYARTRAISLAAEWFCTTTRGNCQLVNLGAGFDTLFWRLRDAGHKMRRFVDVDAASIIEAKRTAIASAKAEFSHDNSATANSSEATTYTSEDNITTGIYDLLVADLRNPATMTASLLRMGIDPTIPTLFLAECVLVYLDSGDTSRLLTELAATFSTAVFVNYEMINPDDAFGKVMVRNLEMRGCPLRGLKGCPDLDAQAERYLKSGWKPLGAADMNEVYRRLPQDDVKRIERLEIFDELEEWQLISNHYCVTSAVIDQNDVLSTSTYPFTC